MSQKHKVTIIFETDAETPNHAMELISTYLWRKGVPQYPDASGNKGYQIMAEKV